jgi:hypothetical protein
MARVIISLERIGDANVGRWRGEVSSARGGGRINIDAIGDAAMLARVFGGLGRLSELDERAVSTWSPPVQEAPPIPPEARAQPTPGHHSTITIKSREEVARQRNAGAPQ